MSGIAFQQQFLKYFSLKLRIIFLDHFLTHCIDIFLIWVVFPATMKRIKSKKSNLNACASFKRKSNAEREKNIFS